MKEILGFQVDEVAAALWMSRALEALIRQRKLKWLYSRTPLTRTLKGNENLFELAGFRVIGVD